MNDSPSHLAANIAKVKAALAIDTLAEARQVHGNSIIVVDAMNYHLLASHDAMMTDHLNIGLKVTHADCQAAIFYDPIHHAIATVHSGWRGHVCNIYSKVISSMASIYHSKPEDPYMAIAPSLGPTHAEFVNYRTEFPQPFWHIKSNYFDLWSLALWQLTEAKILPAHIQMANVCTFANSADCCS